MDRYFRSTSPAHLSPQARPPLPAAAASAAPISRRRALRGLTWLALGWAMSNRAARAGTVAGHLHLSAKNLGSKLQVRLRVVMNWAGLAAADVVLMSADVPKSGQAVTAQTPVPGGGFTTSAWVKNDVLTLKVNARAFSGASVTKTLNLPANKTWGAGFTWTV